MTKNTYLAATTTRLIIVTQNTNASIKLSQDVTPSPRSCRGSRSKRSSRVLVVVLGQVRKSYSGPVDWRTHVAVANSNCGSSGGL